MTFQFKSKTNKTIFGVSSNIYVWEIDDSYIFMNKHQIEMFPLAINLFLQIYDENDKIQIMNGDSYVKLMLLRDEEKSYIKVMVSKISLHKSHDIQQILIECDRNNLVNFEINIIGYEGYYVIMKQDFLNRKLSNDFHVSSGSESHNGICLLGRRIMPGEGEEAKKLFFENGVFFIDGDSIYMPDTYFNKS